MAGNAKILAVVKAEAYGHGLVPLACEFARLGADYLGVSFLEEGVAVRQAGLDLPVLVMGGVVDEQIGRYLDYGLELTVSSVWKARRTEEAAARRRTRARVQVEIDTGMGRTGQNWSTADLLLRELAELKHLDVCGIYSHFATAESDPGFARVQLERFQEVLETARRMGLDFENVHIANSAALLNPPGECRFTMVRPGLMLYGYPPNPEEAGLELTPVMSLRSRVVYVKKPPAGMTVGYGATWRSPGGRWVATVPVGYGDGYPRRAGNRAWVMLRGRRCPVVGMVSMDQITVDAGDEAYLGDEVTLFGRGPGGDLPLWDLARALDAIPYELTTCLTARVPRVYCDSD